MSHRDDPSAASPSEWQSCDARLLDRLLFQFRNQHRKTPYYQKLKQVRRAMRVTERMRMQMELHGTAVPATAESFVHSLVRAQRIILHCSRPLYALLSQTYFMSFALAALALLARLYATNRSQLITKLDQCLPARIVQQQAESSSDAAAGSSVAECLHRALRTEQGEHEWLEEAAAVDNMFATHSADALQSDHDAAAATSNDGDLGMAPLSAFASAPDEGDSDEEDEEATAPAATAAPLPSQLAFFASPAAPSVKASKLQSSPAVAATAAKPMAPKRPLQSTPSLKQSGQKRSAATFLQSDDSEEDVEAELEHDDSALLKQPQPLRPPSASRPAAPPSKPAKAAALSSLPPARRLDDAATPSKATAAAKRPPSTASSSPAPPASAASSIAAASAAVNKKAKLSVPSAASSSSSLALFDKLQTAPASAARPLSSIAAASAASQPTSLKKKLTQKKKSSLPSAASFDEMDDIFG